MASTAHQPDGRPVPPGLHLVATPIGAARDITLRALDVLAGADALAAEDTRTLRHLMDIHGIPRGGRPMIPCHDHNEAEAVPGILALLAAGKSVAYASDAGTPLVSDPGFALTRAAIAAGHPVHAAPGASAVLCALTVAGLPADRFYFAGFLPQKGQARARALGEYSAIRGTVVLYESPRRLQRMLDELRPHFGDDAQVAVCRELTKRFEEVVRGPLAEVAAAFADREVKGEVVVLVNRREPSGAAPEDLDTALRAALATLSLRDAVDAVAAASGITRKDVYQRALALREGDA
jgi:16S rRNA (cytidine1402-2'-O)-methyltransferase